MEKQVVDKVMDEIMENQSGVDLDNDDNTYLGEDGLKYCNKCGEPTQQYRPKVFSPDKFIAYRACKCVRELEALKENEKITREQQEAFRKRQLDCFGESKTMYKFTFENSTSTAETTEYAKRLADEFEKYKNTSSGVLFWGKSRMTKTYTACAIANEIMKQGYTAKLIKITDVIMDVYKEVDKNKFLSELRSYDLLIIDDLGVERNTPYNFELIQKIIDERLSIEKPMIITSNLTLDEIKNPTNREIARIYTRIYENCVPILFSDDSGVDKDVNKRLIAEILAGGQDE